MYSHFMILGCPQFNWLKPKACIVDGVEQLVRKFNNILCEGFKLRLGALLTESSPSMPFILSLQFNGLRFASWIVTLVSSTRQHMPKKFVYS